MSNKERFRFEQDDSAHWYAIPADMENSFNAWVIYMGDESEPYVPYEGPSYEDFRIDHPSTYTFTDLKRDK